ncbi:MAG: hypothetical protein IKB05_00930 [Alphaproteobacteria bacterium]|nr:hypothetical protein [Alphaproteobacteria bacterium]
MKNIDYFKLQAKNLLKDYQTRYLSEDGDIYEYEPKFFDIVGIFLEYGIMDDDKNFEFKLGNAQHLIAQMAGFASWKDLTTAPETDQLKARKSLERSIHNEYGCTSFISHNFTPDGREITEYSHEPLDSDVPYHEELSGKDWQDGIDECRKYGMGFEPDTIVECIHCGKQFAFKEVKVRRLKPEYNDGQEDDFKEIMCKHYPTCNGNLIDLMPAEIQNDNGSDENEK